jgi:hypothetical protein
MDLQAVKFKHKNKKESEINEWQAINLRKWYRMGSK